ncbi:hypothetical protein [Acetobacter estunensis]|uniref:hypothetical protein n=1 Tax=Acetobacter estunensis TaxID=104097 RepID=UPI001C2D43EF|nr:hypothetical protein [Acetobacter estunensis]
MADGAPSVWKSVVNMRTWSMAKDCCKGAGDCASKKGCCSFKKVFGFIVVAGIAGFLWKKFR